MPRERLPMRKIRDVLRLHADKLSRRRIAISLNLGRTAVRDYIKRATRAGLGWPLPEGLSDEAILAERLASTTNESRSVLRSNYVIFTEKS